MTWNNLQQEQGVTRKHWPPVHGPPLRTGGPFLDGPEKFSHPELEAYDSRIININRGSFHKRNFRRIHFSVFRYRWTKNGLPAGPKSFRSFRETGPGSVDYLRTGPRTTPTDPSTDHPPNKIKKKPTEIKISLKSYCNFFVYSNKIKISLAVLVLQSSYKIGYLLNN